MTMARLLLEWPSGGGGAVSGAQAGGRWGGENNWVPSARSRPSPRMRNGPHLFPPAPVTDELSPAVATPIQNGPGRARRIKGLQWQTYVRGNIERQRISRPVANP